MEEATEAAATAVVDLEEAMAEEKAEAEMVEEMGAQ